MIRAESIEVKELLVKQLFLSQQKVEYYPL
jgi:hypothetical protein